MGAQADLGPDGDQELVRRWRLEQFEALGYPPWTARRLARNENVDVRETQRLLKAGATLEQAAALAER